MKRSNYLLALILCAATCVAQSTSPTLQVRVITGAPFTALAVTQSVQTLPDGNQISRTTNAKIARDGEGRTRREQIAANGVSVVFLEDPVSGNGYVIDSAKKSVRRFVITGADKTSGAVATAGSSLGSQVMEGLRVDGTKLTRTVSAGEAGNERAFDVTIEVWHSNDLQTILLRTTTDPRYGETSYKLTDIQRGEPDPMLFTIPTGFTFMEESVASK
jgi:hypothetical protein